MSESLASIFEGQTNERVKRMGKKIPKVDAGPRDLGFRSYSYMCVVALEKERYTDSVIMKER